MRAAAINLLDQLRHRSHSGRLIRQHRALRRLDFKTASWLHPVLLPAFFTAINAAAIGGITRIWGDVLAFWAGKLGWPATFRSEVRWLGGQRLYELSYPQIPAPEPDGLALTNCAVVIFLVMVLSYLLLRRRHLPWAYLCWALCLIQFTAVVYFHFFPGTFPHSIAAHVRGGMEMNATLLFLIPWILAPTFYPFGFPIADKLWVTALMLLNVVVFTPLQYLAHIWVIHRFSLLALPLLFTVFGLLLNVIHFISVYAWAMSREPQ